MMIILCSDALVGCTSLSPPEAEADQLCFTPALVKRSLD